MFKHNIKSYQEWSYIRNFLFFFVFFSWIIFLHISGLYLFTQGFLLTRSTLNSTSSCDIPPYVFTNQEILENDCWYPSTFKKAIIVVIDALRYDFTIENPGSNLYCHNAFTILHETSTKYPRHAFLRPFIADPPTTTLQRLKALTTGTLPTFIDAGSNFAGTVILEDNILAQLKSRGYRIGFLGDDTWISLYPTYFESNITYPFDSFNVWDLDTVDNNINSYLFPLLNDTETTKWDILIVHYLGLDHAGHKYGPNHHETYRKLSEMDSSIRRIISKLQNDTLLIVLGDHGMDERGNHGGDSLDEVVSALWIYNKGSILPEFPSNLSSISQIDFVPTLSLLMGIPIPYNNLGGPIVEAFFFNKNLNWKDYSQAAKITAYQIKRYVESYKNIYGLDGFEDIKAELDLENIEHNLFQNNLENNEFWKKQFFKYITYQQMVLNKFREIWIKFDILRIIAGIIILFGGLLCQFLFYLNSNYLLTRKIDIQSIILKSIIGAGICAVLSKLSFVYLNVLNSALFGGCFVSILSFLSFFLKKAFFIQFPKSFTKSISIILIIIHGLILSSNSFIIWEEKTILFTIFSIYTLNFFSVFSRYKKNIRISTIIRILLLFLVGRMMSLIHQCREEQQPFCKSTFFHNTGIFVSFCFFFFLVFIFLIFLPSTISHFLTNLEIHKDSKSSSFIGFKVGFILILAHSIIDFETLHFTQLKHFNNEKIQEIKIILVRIVLFIYLFIVHLIWIFLSFSNRIRGNSKLLSLLNSTFMLKTYTHKFTNIYYSNYFSFVLSWFIILAILQKPLSVVSFSFLLFQILLYIELLNLLQKDTNSEIDVILFALLGRSHFFSTGHQATLSSIQWDSAFLASKTVLYLLSPALILGNTFGPQIFITISLPLLNFRIKNNTIDTMSNHLFQIFQIYLLYYSMMTTSSVLFTALLRRHLMVWKIFAPKYMTSAIELLLIDTVLFFSIIGLAIFNIFHYRSSSNLLIQNYTQKKIIQ
ncbi:hypothetical protein T552_03480 [Pneumocystis carinii B80]|uniref:Uncharacterized protein n=1 Tax=Pneumocystis carinii (strain B80) TaxID=1408658 RepID=A0A0W4ZAZ0_PNEC8|nr:hypothetical protein T552_03480 [Pneumocystis carinii B80]KTW25620.1 hypothetical protein T552_03480 [Pneumocystis carinii B80]